MNPNPTTGLTTAGNRLWYGNTENLAAGDAAFSDAVLHIGKPFYAVNYNGRCCVTASGTAVLGHPPEGLSESLPLLGYAPALPPETLGDASFKQDLGIRYAYVVGAMANGITSVEMVRAAGKAGMIGFFGAGGLSLEQVETAIDRIQSESEPYPYGFNLIHSPHDQELEHAVVDCYLRRGVHLVSASAYLALTLPLVYYRVKGIYEGPDGCIVCPNRVVAKVSRIEVARKFFAPPPPKMLDELVARGKITEKEANLAQHIPVAQDISAEADSGGHTDNRPALTLLPTFLSLRDDHMREYKFRKPLRVGLGGGIATPQAAAAAFAMGAAYVLTGSINQACIEAETAETVRDMLAKAEQADVTMAPAADMFELGAKVQVLKRGTMFAMRGSKLYELYRGYDRYEDIPQKTRGTIEKDFLKASYDETWESTRKFFAVRDPRQIERAEKDPRHKMALVFRSYLGLSSLWAKTGDPNRRMDYQIWCGPAMGAFNAWARGSFLEKPQHRETAVVAMNLLYGAAVLTRCHMLAIQGITLPPVECRPRTLSEIKALSGC